MSRNLGTIASLVVTASLGFFIGRLWFGSGDESTVSQSTQRPHRTEYVAPTPAPPEPLARSPVPRPMPEHASPSSVDGSPQEQLFLGFNEEARALRFALEWELGDRARERLQACEAMLEAATSCWYRFQVTIRGPRMAIESGAPLSCHHTLPGNKIERLPHVLHNRVVACITGAVRAVTEMGVPSEFTHNVGDYNGPLDVNFTLLPPVPASGSGR